MCRVRLQYLFPLVSGVPKRVPWERDAEHGGGGGRSSRPFCVRCTTLHWEIMLREHTFWGVAPRQPQPKSCQESEDLRKAFTQLFDALCPGPGPGSKSLPPLRVGTYSRASSRTCMINRNLHARLLFIAKDSPAPFV